jgi:membrane protein implicated in regulation of membrane protease activity
MSTNEGSIDRVVRVILGVALLAIVFVGPQSPIGWLGLVPLATGLLGFCPLYRIFGFSTAAAK